MRINRNAVLSAAIVAALAQSSITLADDKFWDGPVNNQWTNGNNWFTTGEPGTGDVAIFDGNSTVQRSLVVLSANREVSQMRVTGVPTPGDYRFVSEGGVLTVPNGLTIETGAGSVAFEGFRVNAGFVSVHPSATLNLLSNATIVGSTTVFGGTLNWGSGSLTGSISVDGGGLIDVTAGGRGLSDGASLGVSGTGRFTTNSYFDIGSSADAGNGPTGTFSVAGGGTYEQTAGGFIPFWGHNGGDVALVQFTNEGVGTLGSGVSIATNGGSATVTIQSDSRLHVGGPLTVGTAPLALVGSGRTNAGGGSNLNSGNANALISIDGGTLTASAAANFNTGARVNLVSGGLQFNDNATFSAGSTFNWSGGTMTVASGKTLTFDGGVGSITLGEPGLSDGATLRVINGAHFDSDGTYDIGYSFNFLSGPTGTLLVSGPGSRFTNASPSFRSTWSDVEGDSATVTFNSSAVGTISNGLDIAVLGGRALVTVSDNAMLTIGNRLNVGTASSNVTINISGGTLTSSGTTSLRQGVVVNYSAGSFSTGSLGMSGNAQVLLTSGGNKVLRTAGLSMSDTSKIDLNDNDMIVGSLTSKAAVENLVRVARNGGPWNGPAGVTSTAAKNATPKNTMLGVLSGLEYFFVSGGSGLFSGQPYSSVDTLVKYTWYGDTDFNGIVNFDDYNRTDAGFNLGRTGWLNGDFDLSGVVNFDDYALIDLAFNSQSGTLRQAMSFLEGGGSSGSDGMDGPALHMVGQHFAQFGQPYATAFLNAVPEPTTAVLGAGLSGLTLVRRRRR